MNKIKKIIFIIILSAIPCLVHAQQDAAVIVTEKKPPITDNINNLLGPAYAENLTKKIEAQINANNYVQAKQNLDLIFEWVADSAEYHTDLYKTLKKLENADKQANIERELAIRFAVLRDKLLLLQAKIFIYNNQKRNAVENLVEIVKSQPETELGFNAYKLLQSTGFTYSVGTEPIKTEPIQPE